MSEIRTTSSTGGQKGVKLERHDLIPAGPLKALAEHYGVGANKYANHQWRRGYEYSKSYSALQRHALEFLAGRSYDVCSNDPTGCQHVDLDGNPFIAARPDACFNHTGSHHMTAVAWHAFGLVEFEAEHPEHDDRYYPEPPPVQPGPLSGPKPSQVSADRIASDLASVHEDQQEWQAAQHHILVDGDRTLIWSTDDLEQKPISLGEGWQEIGFLSDDGIQVEWRDPEPMTRAYLRPYIDLIDKLMRDMLIPTVELPDIFKRPARFSAGPPAETTDALEGSNTIAVRRNHDYDEGYLMTQRVFLDEWINRPTQG